MACAMVQTNDGWEEELMDGSGLGSRAVCVVTLPLGHWEGRGGFGKRPYFLRGFFLHPSLFLKMQRPRLSKFLICPIKRKEIQM